MQDLMEEQHTYTGQNKLAAFPPVLSFTVLSSKAQKPEKIYCATWYSPLPFNSLIFTFSLFIYESQYSVHHKRPKPGCNNDQQMLIVCMHVYYYYLSLF